MLRSELAWLTCSEQDSLCLWSRVPLWAVLLIRYSALCLQTALETQVLDEKDKAQRLQTELDVSEQVQKDFVKLSQTLQVTKAL